MVKTERGCLDSYATAAVRDANTDPDDNIIAVQLGAQFLSISVFLCNINEKVAAVGCLHRQQEWLRDYEYTYLERDLADLVRLADLSPFRKFQRLAAQRSGCLLKLPGGIIGVEVKARTRVAATDARSLCELARHLGQEWLGGLVVYCGETIEQISKPSIWTVPAHRLLT